MCNPRREPPINSTSLRTTKIGVDILVGYPAPPRGGYIRGAIGRYCSYDLLMGFHPYIITMVLPNPNAIFLEA